MDGGTTRAEYRLMETRLRELAKFFEQSRPMWREQAEQALQEQQRLAAEDQRLQEQLAAATVMVEKKSVRPAD
jgi:hypothetical protein